MNDESDSDRLDGLIANNALSLDLVSAFAGDRGLSTPENIFLDELKIARADKFYGDLLYVISHQFFPPKLAYDLWIEILKHKIEMSQAMKRNIKIVVATLDYLCNLTNDIKSTTLISEEHIAKIISGSLRDGLTGLYNHAYCHRAIATELKRFERYGILVSLMMIDIDHFKKINDRYGHQEGDKVLAGIAILLRLGTRECDICCRYGGEEFVAILPSTGGGDAEKLAEKLRIQIEKSQLISQKITVSIGVATCGENYQTPYSIIKTADEAMYISKSMGRNRVVFRGKI